MSVTRKWLLYLGVAVIAAMLAACEADEREENVDASPEAQREQQAEPAREHAAPGLVELKVGDFFIDAPGSIPSGWTTFRMENTGEQEHFVVLWPLPEGVSYADFQAEILTPFQKLVQRYDADELDRGALMEQLGVVLPEWAGQALQGAGGVGMMSPGQTGISTVHLSPGGYVLECYVRMPNGTLHNMIGMVGHLTVTGESNDAPEPQADRVMNVHADRIEIDTPLTAGKHLIQVNYRERPQGLLTHDINLARLAGESGIDEIVAWMDWVDGMRAPAPVTFLGGIEHMPEGSTGYMSVNLEPGRYLWISEEYGAQGVLQEFEIE